MIAIKDSLPLWAEHGVGDVTCTTWKLHLYKSRPSFIAGREPQLRSQMDSDLPHPTDLDRAMEVD